MSDVQADLDWLTATLGDPSAPGAGFRHYRRSNPAPLHGRDLWLSLTSEGQLRRLVPLAPAALAEALDNAHDAMSPRRLQIGSVARRITEHAPHAVVRAGAARAGRLIVGPPQSLLDDLAATVPGWASCAITLGPRRYNRKPVIQLISDTGVTVGYAKVAVDDLTATFIDTERDSLAAVNSATDLGPVSTPSLVHVGDWQGRPLVVISPVRPSPHTPEQATNDRLVNIVAGIAQSAATRRITVGESPIVGDVRSLADASTAEAPAGIDRQQLDQVLTGSVVELTCTVGRWHGDLSPWNMMTGPDSTGVIDWEFSHDHMSLGSDLVHHGFMVATHLGDLTPADALDSCRTSCTALYRSAGVADADISAHFVLWLLELVRRDLELASHGVAPATYGAAALSVLRTATPDRPGQWSRHQ